MITQEEAIAELKRRGVDPNAGSVPQTSSVTPEQARTELRSRGIDPDAPGGSSSSDSSVGQIAGAVGRGALNTLSAPFQAVGEAIRMAGSPNEPMQVATAVNPQGFRAPSILQQMMPSLQTPNPPADPFAKAYQGLEGIGQTVANLPKGIGPALQAGSNTIQGNPDVAATLGGLGIALGTGDAGNLPFQGAVNAAKGAAGLVPKAAEAANIIKDVDREVLAMSQKYNVPITAAGQTGGGTQASVENFLSRMPFSKDVIANNAKGTLSALDQNVRQPLIAGAKDDTELAPLIQDSFRQSGNTAKANAQSLYSNASNALPEDAKIPMDTLSQKASDLLKAQTKLPQGAQASGASQLLQDLAGRGFEGKDIGQVVMPGEAPRGVTGSAVAEYDYPTVQALRAELNSRIAGADQGIKSGSGMAFQSSPEAGIYKQLKGALDQDLNKFSDTQGGAFKNSFDQANSTYSQYKQTFTNNKFIKSIMTEQDPAKIVSKAMNVDNPNAIAALKTNLPAPVLNDLQTSFIKDMTEKVPGQFSPAHFVTQYEKIGPDKLNSFLGPTQMQKLQPLYTLSKASVQAEKIGANPSGTSQGMMSAMGLTAPVMQLLRGHALGAASILGGEAAGLPLAAKAYLSEPVTNLLTNQTNGIANTANAAGQAAPAGAVSQNIQNLIQQLQQKYAKRRQF